MPDRDKVSRCVLSVTLFMFLMAVAVSMTPVADLDGTAHQSTTAVSDTRRGGTLLAGTPHGPIAIDGDANFADTALLEGWPGDGSPENPYIIDGLDIYLGGGDGSCIGISNTRVSFTITNCNLTGPGLDSAMPPSGVGIYLENVTNGELVNNTCSSNTEYGIHLYLSSYNTVVNNTCNDGNGDGIFLSVSSHNTVSDNTCNNNRWGICIVESDYNTVENNTCSSNLYVGIRTSDAGWNEIHYNTCSSNTEYGISLEVHSDSNTISVNTCNNNAHGISLGNSDSNTVTNNICNSNRIGISLGNSDSNIVTNNICNNNKIGIYLFGSDANILENNICSGNIQHTILEEFETEEFADILEENVVLLLIGLVGIIMLGARWRMAKLSRAEISETWIGGSAIVKS